MIKTENNKFHTFQVVSLGFAGGLLVTLMVFGGLGWVLALIIAALIWWVAK